MIPISEAIRKRLTLTRTAQRLRRNPYLGQERTFNRLLVKAKDTAFGKYYRFEEMLASKDPLRQFRERVPLCNYDSIHEWWQRAEAGEPDVCWPGKIKYFALSSGTSGAPSKNIPVSRDLIKATQQASVRQLLILRRFKVSPTILSKKILTLSGSTTLQYFGNHYRGDVSGIHAKHIPPIVKTLQKPGRRISGAADWESRLRMMVKSAPNWDIGVVAGVPAWLDILMERIEERYKVKSIHEVWPNFQAFIHGGVAIEPYRKKLHTHFGREVAFIETYLASEGFIALQSSPEAKGMELLSEHGIFYEFLPFNETNFDGDGQLTNSFARTFTLNEIELGRPYALVMSTCAGAWRYLIGDVVRFVNYSPPELVIEGRTKHFLSLVGEHLSVDNMTQAIAHTADALGLTFPEFGVTGMPFEGRFAHQWYISCDSLADPNVVQAQLDVELKRLNDDYAVERIHALKHMFVKLLPNQIFIDYLAGLGKSGGQSKFPRVLKGSQFESWQAFLNSRGLL
jgi:phenylacetate-coenzyme A ligase PaaK-like adenylate-forming protein